MINDEQLNDRLIPDLFSRPGPATTVQQRPTPAASRATPRRSCFGRAAGDRRDGGARMPAGRRWEGPCGSGTTFDPALDRLQQSASGASCSMVSQPAKSSLPTQLRYRGLLRQRGMLFTGQPQSTDGKPARKHARRRSTKATESPVKSTRAQLHSTSDRDSQ